MTDAKLIRDLIPEVLERLGLTPVTRVADLDEYRQRLRAKLQEEVAEFLESESIEELADVLEVVDALREINGASLEELAKLKLNKRTERGGFEKRLILERVESVPPVSGE